MSEIDKIWSVASLSIDGVKSPSSISEQDGLLGLSAVYTNNICDMLNIKQFFKGNVLENGQLDGGLTDDAEFSTLALIYRHLATQGNVVDGKLDMSGTCEEWLSSLPYLVDNGKLDVSSFDDSIVLQMVSVQLNLDSIEPDPAMLNMPGHDNDSSPQVMP